MVHCGGGALRGELPPGRPWQNPDGVALLGVGQSAAAFYRNTTDCRLVISILFPHRGVAQRTMSSMRTM